MTIYKYKQLQLQSQKLVL